MSDPHITEEQGRILMDLYRQNEVTQARLCTPLASEVQVLEFPSGEQHFLSPKQIGLHQIEAVSIHRGMVAIDGWARAGIPGILCDGVPAPTYSFRVRRPDLTDAHGSAATFWGFTLRSVVGPNEIERSQISLLFPNGAILEI